MPVCITILFLFILVIKVNVSTALKGILGQQEDQLSARVVHLDERSTLVHAIINLQLLLVTQRATDICLHFIVQRSWCIVQSLDIVVLLYRVKERQRGRFWAL